MIITNTIIIIIVSSIITTIIIRGAGIRALPNTLNLTKFTFNTIQ